MASTPYFINIVKLFVIIIWVRSLEVLRRGKEVYEESWWPSVWWPSVWGPPRDQHYRLHKSRDANKSLRNTHYRQPIFPAAYQRAEARTRVEQNRRCVGVKESVCGSQGVVSRVWLAGWENNGMTPQQQSVTRRQQWKRMIKRWW